MARKYMFVDEAGNFDFSLNGSKYFLLTSMTLEDCSIGNDLLELRRELTWEGVQLTNDTFHATEEKQAVRDRVFAVLGIHGFRIDSTLFEKRKAQPYLHNAVSMYNLAWYLHMSHVAPRVANQEDSLMVIGASIATRKKQVVMGGAIANAVKQTVNCSVLRTSHWQASTDPCLQAVDYCCWAIQRKWERADSRSHTLIVDKIASEYDYFERGTTFFY